MKQWVLPGIDVAIPKPPSPGAFGVSRKHDIHTGIDLYCPENTPVAALEDGQVVAIENFTGPNADGAPSPWWNDTQAILIEGSSGVICYGEVEPFVKVGDFVQAGEIIAKVKQVLKIDKGKPMSMLHFELYQHGAKETVWWHDAKPSQLLDPTSLLEQAG